MTLQINGIFVIFDLGNQVLSAITFSRSIYMEIKGEKERKKRG